MSPRVFFLHLSTALFFFCRLSSQEVSRKGFLADAAVLYLQAHEDGLGYALKSPAKNKIAPNARVETPDFEWDFGFSIGTGYRFPHDLWGFLLQFTSLQTHADNEKEASDGNVLFPLWQKSSSGGPFYAENAKVHWRLHLGLVDLKLTKSYEPSKSLSLTSQAGIRVGSIRQKYYLEYRGGNLPMNEDAVHMKNKYLGAGPAAALIGEWRFGKGLSLMAKNSFSLLFGEFYIHQDEYADKEKLLGVHNVFHSSAAILENSAGIRWQHFFQEGPLKRLALKLSWDQMLFFSQNQLMHFVNADLEGLFVANQGDLSISGVEFNMQFDF